MALGRAAPPCQSPGVSRAQRLLELLQVLRRHRRPVTGATLAQELGVSLRTLYRDIASLQAQGAEIAGEAGLGYVLRPGLHAAAADVRQRRDRGDGAGRALGRRARRYADGGSGAQRARQDRRRPAARPRRPPRFLGSAHRTRRSDHGGRRRTAGDPPGDPRRRKLAIAYADGAGAQTRRVVWPFALAFFDRARVVVAWCETRAAFRHFRTDRIAELAPMAERYPRRRAALLREWRQAEDLGEA